MPKKTTTHGAAVSAVARTGGGKGHGKVVSAVAKQRSATAPRPARTVSAARTTPRRPRKTR